MVRSNTPTGSVLAAPLINFGIVVKHGIYCSTFLAIEQIQHKGRDQPLFVFLNVGETHVPYWHEDADWERWPSPCVPFGKSRCSRRESRRRQIECLEWVDSQLATFLDAFSPCTVLACSDHVDCWGEDDLWEHGISHQATLTVPLLMRVRGEPISL